MKASINKIGNLALNRIYGNLYDPQGDYERTFVIANDDYNLLQNADPSYFRSHKFGVRYNTGTSHEVWGIKLGLKKFRNSPNTLFEAIIEIVKESKEVPSHLIKREYTSDDYTGTKETYTVYRIRQEQKQIILKNVPVC